VVGGLLFDPAGGLAFAAPFAVDRPRRAPALWRRGGPGERALLAGGAANRPRPASLARVVRRRRAPARYLVPLLPAFALAGAQGSPCRRAGGR